MKTAMGMLNSDKYDARIMIPELKLPVRLAMRWTSCSECPAGQADGDQGVWCTKFRTHYDYDDGCSKGPLG